MEKDDRITERQLIVLAFVGLLAPVIRTVPHLSALSAGRAAWLSPVPGAAAAMAYFVFLRRSVKRRKDGEGLFEISKRALGRAGGTAFSAIFGLWLVFYSGFIARSAAERLLAAVYENGRAEVFIVVITAAALAAALGMTKTLVRTAEAFLPLMLAVIALTILFSFSEIKTEFLLPVTYFDAGEIFLGALPVLNVAGSFSYFLFLAGYVQKSEKGPGKGLLWTAVLALVIFLITLVTVGSVSAPVAAKLQNPFFTVIRNVTLFGIIERIEAPVIAVWIVTDVVYLASCLMISGGIWKSVFAAAKRKHFVLATAALSVPCALFAARDSFALARLSETLVPAVNTGLAFILVPLVFAVGKLRKKL